MARPIGTKDSAIGLSEIIDSAKSTIVLITPYVQLSYSHKRKLDEASKAGKQILLVCRREELYPNQLEELKSISNLKLIDHANVHAKCYFNESQLLITSLNFYNHSIENNVELGTWFDNSESQDKFSRALSDAISALNIGALNLELAKIFGRSGISSNFDRKNFEKQFNLFSFKPLPDIQGYCIRCCDQMNYLNGSYPLCTNCFVEWTLEYDFNFPEKCCHWCGKRQATSKAKPLCYTCFTKYRLAIKKEITPVVVPPDENANIVTGESRQSEVLSSLGEEVVKQVVKSRSHKKVLIGASLLLIFSCAFYLWQRNPAISSDQPTREDALKEIIRNYYIAWQKSPDSIAAYFAPKVDNFITMTNLTPVEIVQLANRDSREFAYPQTLILDSTFSMSRDPRGNIAISFWVRFKCFRSSKKQYQKCNVHEEFVFDSDNKIIAINELSVQDLNFSFQDPKW